MLMAECIWLDNSNYLFMKEINNNYLQFKY